MFVVEVRNERSTLQGNGTGIRENRLKKVDM